MPDVVLQAVGNAGLHVSLSTLQVRFLLTNICCRSSFHSAYGLLAVCRAMKIVSDMQRVFIRSLAKDYARWATDARYDP